MMLSHSSGLLRGDVAMKTVFVIYEDKVIEFGMQMLFVVLIL